MPRPIPVSVALGELTEWAGGAAPEIPCDAWTGLAYRKLGLSHAPHDWIDRWRDLRHRLAESGSAVPAWVAVVYIDWQAARAPLPRPSSRRPAAIDACHGVLFDTWDKSKGPGIDLTWKPQVDRVRSSGRFVALAGSLDVHSDRPTGSVGTRHLRRARFRVCRRRSSRADRSGASRRSRASR